jgi:RNA polymerase sigma factor (TIGR02999 family)
LVSKKSKSDAYTKVMGDVTQLLNDVSNGDPKASEQLWSAVYNELRSLAAAQVAGERSGHTLTPTALVNEAYLRLAADTDQGFSNRRHFFGAAATAMRRILVESARSRGRDKRGGGRQREQRELDAIASGGSDADLLDLHEALEKFAAVDPDRAKLVELRFFAGLTLPEAAECLGISLSTADRSWRYARAWLHTAMNDNPSGQTSGEK